MKPFEFYIKIKEVRRISPDINLAKALVQDMEERIKTTNKLSEEFSKIIFENYYDALRNFCDALIAKEGYKSYSHEATISNLEKYNFTFPEISKLDKFRQLRNNSKYTGKLITKGQADNIKKFYQNVKHKIHSINSQIIN